MKPGRCTTHTPKILSDCARAGEILAVLLPDDDTARAYAYTYAHAVRCSPRPPQSLEIAPRQLLPLSICTRSGRARGLAPSPLPRPLLRLRWTCLISTSRWVGWGRCLWGPGSMRDDACGCCGDRALAQSVTRRPALLLLRHRLQTVTTALPTPTWATREHETWLPLPRVSEPRCRGGAGRMGGESPPSLGDGASVRCDAVAASYLCQPPPRTAPHLALPRTSHATPLGPYLPATCTADLISAPTRRFSPLPQPTGASGSTRKRQTALARMAWHPTPVRSPTWT